LSALALQAAWTYHSTDMPCAAFMPVSTHVFASTPTAEFRLKIRNPKHKPGSEHGELFRIVAAIADFHCPHSKIRNSSADRIFTAISDGSSRIVFLTSGMNIKKITRILRILQMVTAVVLTVMMARAMTALFFLMKGQGYF